MHSHQRTLQLTILCLQASDLGVLMELVACNARSIQTGRGALGVLNWVGDRLLWLAHLAR